MLHSERPSDGGRAISSLNFVEMVSVIIVNFHSAYLAKRAVESVYSDNENTEVFVVDNTATPDERQTLQSILPSGTHLIFNERNDGFGKACNKAYALSNGEWIFLLNPDAYVIPPCLGTLMSFLTRTPEAAAAAPLVFWDSAMTYFFPRAVTPSPAHDILIKLSDLLPLVRTLYSLSVRKQNISLWKSLLPVRVKNLSGGTVMLKRSAIEKAGGLFDERFFLFYEDTDLFLRLRKAGYSAYIVPSAKAIHAHKHTKAKLEIMAHMRVQYYKKHFHRSLLHYIAAMLPNHAPRIKYIDFGDFERPPVFHVPPEVTRSYLFELSPNHLFIPSVGYFGSGDTLFVSEELWNALDGGEYFSRFTDTDARLCKNGILRWRKILTIPGDEITRDVHASSVFTGDANHET